MLFDLLGGQKHHKIFARRGLISTDLGLRAVAALSGFSMASCIASITTMRSIDFFRGQRHLRSTATTQRFTNGHLDWTPWSIVFVIVGVGIFDRFTVSSSSIPVNFLVEPRLSRASVIPAAWPHNGGEQRAMVRGRCHQAHQAGVITTASSSTALI
jgi:hypothetical protein